MTGPAVPNTGSPFGSWGPIVASLIAMLIVGAAVVDHLLAALGRIIGADPFLDSAALLVIGVVLGVGAIGSTSSAALASAQAAHLRLDEIAAPPATPPAASVG